MAFQAAYRSKEPSACGSCRWDRSGVELTQSRKVAPRDCMMLTQERKKELIGTYQRGTSDTGSAEIQIALLSGRITYLTQHLKQHRKDFASRRGLLMMVSRRRRLLDYLKPPAPQRYLDIIQSLDIRK